MHRLPRFTRATPITRVQITERDLRLVRHVFEHRFLRSTHLINLLGGNPQPILRRLRLLFHHGYLDRPRAQIDYYRSGSRPMVYGVGNRGATVLEEQLSIPRRFVDWTAKNRTTTRLFIEHALAVADVLVGLELSCRNQNHVSLLRPPNSSDKVRWNVTLASGGASLKLGIVPDAVFGLKSTASETPVWFFLEADRATTPVKRPGLKQTSIYRKLLAYHETWRQQILSKRFPRFRVIFVTTTAERANHLIQIAHDFSKGLFLFADRNSFLADPNMLRAPMRDGRGDRATLAD